MIRSIFYYGAIAGLIVGIPLFGIAVAMDGEPPASWGMALGYTTMLIALSTVFVAIKRWRDVDLGGVVRFWPAFGYGLAISAVAGVFYALAWEAALAVMSNDFLAVYAQAELDRLRAAGASAAEIARASADMEAFRASYANPAYRMAISFFAEFLPVGVLVSLVSAGLLRNSRFLAARAA